MNYRFRFDLVFAHFDQLLAGVLLTVQLSISAALVGLVIATMCAVAKINAPLPIRFVVSTYVEVIRNTPFLVQIFIIYFGLPTVGIRLGPDTAAFVAMTLYFGAYATEILRAGIEAVPKGQREAGLALGLSGPHVFIYVIVKPAIKSIYPALTSQYVLLMLQSSVVSAISAEELTALANDIASRTFASFEVYLVITVIYFVLGIIFSYLFLGLFKLVFSYPDR